jgi:hypothetical protein
MPEKKKYEVHGVDEELDIHVFATDNRDAAEEKEKEFENKGLRDVRLVEK